MLSRAGPRGACETHDKERDPGHYVDLTDDGKAMGILALDKLPVTREAYDTQVRAGGSAQYKAGYLSYSIVDGWQQIRKDFAYWRAAVKGAETASSPEERAWFEADRRLREKLTLRDIVRARGAGGREHRGRGVPAGGCVKVRSPVSIKKNSINNPTVMAYSRSSSW